MSSDFPIRIGCAIKDDLYALTTAGRSMLVAFLISIHNMVEPHAVELFIGLFFFRYLRLFVHTISFLLYKPTPIPEYPSYLRSDCTVIIPTTDPEKDVGFLQCLSTVLANRPDAVIVTTVGKENLMIAKRMCAPLNAANGHKIRVIQQDKGNKRRQVCYAVPYVETDIIVTVDATVFWPSTNFLPAILAPFEDENVGVVGTYKRVLREPFGFSFKSFWNFIGCLYLERHNFEVAATTNIDGGAFVISGRTAAYRTEILADPAFTEGFTNEMFFFGLCGPLNPDDDNFITRWVVRRGWKVRFQYSEDAMIQTRVGTYPKYLSQCLRWVRTTWRSNSATLFTDPFRKDCVRSIYQAQPWCVYAVYFTSFFNFALFTDAALLYLVPLTKCGNESDPSLKLKAMICFIVFSKVVKPLPHLTRNPCDIVFLPFYILFGYYHSLLKLYALFTFWNCTWSGRVVKDADNSVGARESDISDDYTGDSSEYSPSPIDISNTDDGFNFYVRTTGNAGVTRRNVGARHAGSAPTNLTQTPWGAVETQSPDSTPANVLEARIPGHIGKLCGREARPEREISKSKTPASKSKTPSKLYTWTRGSNCERLHSDGHNMTPVRQRCVLGGPSGYSGTPLA